MKKYPLIGVSICVVILIVLGSLNNVVGYQTVQSSNQQILKEEIYQKELLFQTIVDFTNNKEIQQIILKSQIIRGEFPVLYIPVLTRNQLNLMYFIGLMLSKIISKSKIHSMVDRHQFNNLEMQKEINIVIEKNATLKGEITQLSNSECDCEKENTTGLWKFPVICMGLYLIFWFFFVLYLFEVQIAYEFVILLNGIGSALDCFWAPY